MALTSNHVRHLQHLLQDVCNDVALLQKRHASYVMCCCHGVGGSCLEGATLLWSCSRLVS